MSRPNPMRGVAPCRKCPFRNDCAPYLRHDRAQEIAQGLLDGGSFTCHETTVPADGEDDGQMVDGPNAMHCAGAMIVLEKMGAPNQIMRISERLGQYDPTRLRIDTAPVHDSLTDWVRAHAPAPTTPVDTDELVPEHCGVVGPDCEAPAGWLAGGAVLENTDEPTCDVWCRYCGSAMCASCVSGQDTALCLYCGENP